MEWLDSTIKERIKMVIENVGKDHHILSARFQYKDSYEELKHSVNTDLQESLKVIDESKETMLQAAIDLAYKSGFRDAMDLCNLIKK